MTVAGLAPSMPRRRFTVAWKGLCLSSSRGRNCLGQLSRDMGQRRVPQPPARITGWTVGGMGMVIDLVSRFRFLEDDEDRAPDDLQVQAERPVAQVVEVV